MTTKTTHEPLRYRDFCYGYGNDSDPKHVSSVLGTGMCPECFRNYKLTKAGRLPKHREESCSVRGCDFYGTLVQLWAHESDHEEGQS